jgi:hypothetical protein
VRRIDHTKAGDGGVVRRLAGGECGRGGEEQSEKWPFHVHINFAIGRECGEKLHFAAGNG